MKKFLIWAALVSFASCACAEGNADTGKELAITCLACHGETGNSLVPDFPNVAGQHEKYLLKQLREIRDGDRPSPTMVGLLDNMSDQDLADIAAFYAAQPGNFGAARAELVELGENIYRGGIPRKNVAACIACHAPDGSGNGPAAFPSLAGQWPEYTVSQLRAFQSGERINDGDAGMMRDIARDMNPQEMEAVASYIYGLR